MTLEDTLRQIIREELRAIPAPQTTPRPPFYTLEQLAEMSGLSLDSWRRVAKLHSAFFVKVAGVTIIRSSSLDELLQLHEGGELPTRFLSQETRDQLTRLRREGGKWLPGPAGRRPSKRSPPAEAGGRTKEA